MKYVMFERKIGDDLIQKIPIIFPNSLSHCDIDKAVRASVPELKDAQAVSAGELQVTRCNAVGSSSTLQLSSDESDSMTIMLHDYAHGIDSAP